MEMDFAVGDFRKINGEHVTHILLAISEQNACNEIEISCVNETVWPSILVFIVVLGVIKPHIREN